MAKKILKWIGISLVVIGMLMPLIFFGGMFLIFWFAFPDEQPPYEPQPDGYWQKMISKEIALNVRDSEVLYEMDTHGGFLGDGDATIVLRMNDDLTEVIEGDSLWHELPLPKELKMGVFCDEEGKRLTGEIENGYYFFMDRHSEATDVFDPSDLYKRASRNYSFAVYDADENILYFYALDT